MNLTISETETMINVINDLAFYLYHNAPMTDFKMFSDGTTSTVYRLNNHYITVKRDANDKSYSISFQLKEFSTLDGNIHEGIIATSTGDIPFWTLFLNTSSPYRNYGLFYLKILYHILYGKSSIFLWFFGIYKHIIDTADSFG